MIFTRLFLSSFSSCVFLIIGIRYIKIILKGLVSRNRVEVSFCFSNARIIKIYWNRTFDSLLKILRSFLLDLISLQYWKENQTRKNAIINFQMKEKKRKIHKIDIFRKLHDVILVEVMKMVMPRILIDTYWSYIHSYTSTSSNLRSQKMKKIMLFSLRKQERSI